MSKIYLDEKKQGITVEEYLLFSVICQNNFLSCPPNIFKAN